LEDTRTRVREFLSRHFKVAQLRDEDRIFSLGFVNSMFAMQLVLFVEKNFDIEVGESDLDMANFSSINSIVDFIERKQKFSCVSDDGEKVATPQAETRSSLV
jgi:methoxymalonate biosynthesis acyl carrier protein